MSRCQQRVQNARGTVLLDEQDNTVIDTTRILQALGIRYEETAFSGEATT